MEPWKIWLIYSGFNVNSTEAKMLLGSQAQCPTPTYSYSTTLTLSHDGLDILSLPSSQLHLLSICLYRLSRLQERDSGPLTFFNVTHEIHWQETGWQKAEKKEAEVLFLFFVFFFSPLPRYGFALAALLYPSNKSQWRTFNEQRSHEISVMAYVFLYSPSPSFYSRIRVGGIFSHIFHMCKNMYFIHIHVYFSYLYFFSF